MKKICQNNLQRHLTSLIAILENCVPLIDEVERSKGELNILPQELESLKKKAGLLQNKSQSASQVTLQNTEYQLDYLVNNLEITLTYLASLEYQLKNIVVLKEQLEAIQEERINGITPERIYKLLKQKKRSSSKKIITSDGLNEQNNSHSKGKNWQIWQKINNFSQQFRNKRTAVSIGIIASISFGWMVGYYSSNSSQNLENQAISKTEQLNLELP